MSGGLARDLLTYSNCFLVFGGEGREFRALSVVAHHVYLRGLLYNATVCLHRDVQGLQHLTVMTLLWNIL